MMNTSLTVKKPLNYHRKERLPPLIEKKNEWSSNNLSAEIARLSKCINKICHEPDVTLDEILKSSNSTLGKLSQLFFSLKDNKDNLLNSKVFDDLIRKNNEDLIIKSNQINKHSMNFIQFIKQIQLIAKENQLSKEYLYQKLLRQKFFINNQNQNNNAFNSSLISHDLLVNEYNNDFSRLQQYFNACSDKSNEMTCSTFVKCFCQNPKFNKVDIRLELNGLFYQIQSSLVNQGVYIPASLTIDFHGFVLCLQHIARRFHFNLRILIKHLINKNQK